MPTPLDAYQLEDLLEDILWAEASSKRSSAESLARLDCPQQDFVLQWVRALEKDNTACAYQFLTHAHRALSELALPDVEAWIIQGLDVYDQSGLYAAVDVFKNVDKFLERARIARELPGVHRDMQHLNAVTGLNACPPDWESWRERLSRPGSCVEDSLAVVATLAAAPPSLPEPLCYQGKLHPELVEEVMRARLEEERAGLRSVLVRYKKELEAEQPASERKEASDKAPTPFSARKKRSTVDPKIDDFVGKTRSTYFRHLLGLRKTFEALRGEDKWLKREPDDYSDEYRSEYGIEDTRRAQIEAKRSGIHPFCITIDKEGQDYLPHMYGAVNYTVVDEVEKLPYKVSEIYRRLTV